MNKSSKNIIKSTVEAREIAEGRPTAARVHVIEVPDVRGIRRKLRMSQSEFAEKYRIPLPTLKTGSRGGDNRTLRQRPIFMRLRDGNGKLVKR
jgi:putative transcriptional regulator